MEPSGRITRNRRKLEHERHQALQDAKRACTQFLPRVVIGPQDIVGNRSVPKVKVQAESVKREVVELAQTPQEELVKEVQVEETKQVQINGEVDKEHLIVKQEVDKVVTTPKIEESGSQTETSPVVEQEISIDNQNSKVTMRSVGTDTADESSVNVEAALRKEIEVLKREGLKKDARIKSLVIKVEDLKQEVRRFEQLNERLLDAVNDNNGDQPSSEPQLISPEPRNSKIFLLFPQVSQVLWTKYGYPTLGKKHFLTCRLVCSSWKSSIDTMDQGPVENLKEFINVSWENGHFEEISSVLNEYKKYVVIQPSTLKISSGFHNKVYTDPNSKCRHLITKFLTLYGHSIKVFQHCENTVALDTHFESVEDWYKTLTSWLHLMPNLEQLTIQRHNPSFPNPDEDYPSPPPFPFLARLNSFTSTGIPASVIRKVLFANPQISQVNLKLKKVLNAIFDNLPLPHLSSLTVHCLSCKIANLRSLQLIDAENLSTLNMQVSSHGSKQVVCFGVTRLIARFQNTVQALQLDRIEPDKLVQDFPQMPKLAKLDVELKYDAVIEKSENLLRFLTPMQLSLEQLWIKESHGCAGFSVGSSGCRCRGTNAWERYKRINTKFVGQLWSKWKKLKSVTICTAHGYQKNHSQEFWFIRKRYC